MSKIKLFNSAMGYDLAATDYDKKESYLNSFEQKKIIPLLGNVIGQEILDVGAGTGRLTIELARAGARVTALDISPKMLRRLSQKNPSIQIVVGEAETLSFLHDTFDIVVAAFLIVHLKDPTRFFDEAYRVLKNGGCLVATNINQKDPPTIKTKEGEIIIKSFYHRPEKIVSILQSLAFTIEDSIFVKEGEKWVNQIIKARK